MAKFQSNSYINREGKEMCPIFKLLYLVKLKSPNTFICICYFGNLFIRQGNLALLTVSIKNWFIYLCIGDSIFCPAYTMIRNVIFKSLKVVIQTEFNARVFNYNLTVSCKLRTYCFHLFWYLIWRFTFFFSYNVKTGKMFYALDYYLYFKRNV